MSLTIISNEDFTACSWMWTDCKSLGPLGLNLESFGDLERGLSQRVHD